jgi:choline dehydrogenase-like flavoprotein
MLKVTTPVPLLTTPSARFFALSCPLTVSDQRSSTVAGKTFLFEDGYQLTANIFPITPNLLETLVGIRATKILLNVFGARFLSRLCVGSMYFPSITSNNSAEVRNNTLKITGNITPALTHHFKDSLRKLKYLTRKFGYRILPWGSKLLAPGADVHYAGTFPMNSTPKRLQCDRSGLVYGLDGFYITDATALPVMTAKPHTFNSMAQSHLIGKKFKLRESSN